MTTYTDQEIRTALERLFDAGEEYNKAIQDAHSIPTEDRLRVYREFWNDRSSKA